MKPKVMMGMAVILAAAGAATAAAELKMEGKLEPFLGEPEIKLEQLFKGDRSPNVVVAVDGTVLAFWKGVKVRRSEDGGETWGKTRGITKNCRIEA